MIKRLATLDDVPKLIELRKKQLHDEELSSNTLDISTELTSYFSTSISNESFIAWVMVENDEIIATSGVCFYTLPPTFSNPSGKVAYITNMYTKPVFRNRGIASELLQEVINEAKNNDCKVIRLHASEYGKSIYLKAGFTESSGYMALRI